MTDRVDTVVIGAGVVGLAAARVLARAGREVVVLESETLIGSGTSSRNSEVVHAGIYYPAGSLKARLCVRGRRMLYRYCASAGIAHRRCGKFIVATADTQRAELDAIRARAAANDVELLPLSGAQAREAEPALACVAALHSPETGIVDSHGLMLALQGDLERDGGSVALASPARRLRRIGDGWLIDVGSGDEVFELAADEVVNAAGLLAPALAARTEGLPAAHLPRAWYAKGNYYALAGRAPFSRLIYPVPEAAGLGVHLTIDLGGQARFGPDVEWVDTIDYRVDPRRADAFYAEIRRYWPALPDGALQPAYAGIRPKLQAPGEPAHDFVVDGPSRHGMPGLVNLFGIESPGLTASLALGEAVAAALGVTADRDDPAWVPEGDG